MPKIGSGSNKLTRFLLPSGFKKMLLRNVKDIELLLMNNRTFAGEIANNVSAKKRYSTTPALILLPYRKLIVARAKEMNVRLTNSTGKLKKVSAE